MTTKRKAVWCGAIVLAISICIGVAMVSRASSASPTVARTDDGWKCSGEIIFSPSRRPRRVGENVIVLERFPGTGGK